MGAAQPIRDAFSNYGFFSPPPLSTILVNPNSCAATLILEGDKRNVPILMDNQTLVGTDAILMGFWDER